jgi:uncharacterized protein YjiS (DUF1127 family)
MTTLRLHHFVEQVEISSTVYGMVRRIESAAAKVQKTFVTWASRADGRRQLAELNDRMLDDIGLTRTEAAVETSKFFWQR